MNKNGVVIVDHEKRMKPRNIHKVSGRRRRCPPQKVPRFLTNWVLSATLLTLVGNLSIVVCGHKEVTLGMSAIFGLWVFLNWDWRRFFLTARFRCSGRES